MSRSDYRGVFETMEECISAAKKAQKELVTKYSLEDRDRFIASIQKVYKENVEELSKLELEETGFGRLTDKIDKNMGTVNTLPGTESIKHNVLASEKGITIEFHAPFGVVGAVTPSTNPSITIMGNGGCCMVAGNAVVFNGHPGAKKSTAWAVDIFNEAVVKAGGPENLVCTVKEPTMDTLEVIMKSPDVKLLVGTGGPGMVATLMKSGKRVIAAGAGNPPCIVDETANIAKAAKGIYDSVSYENNTMCITEKEIYVVDEIFDKFIEKFIQCGAYEMSKEEVEKVTATGLIKTEEGYITNKKCVGKSASEILKMAGIDVNGEPGVAFFVAEQSHPYVHTEQLQPVIPIVRCRNFAQAVEWAVEAEHDCKHSAGIWSNDIYRVTEFGRVIDTTVFVQNGSTSAAFGAGGTGRDSATIATPTGEGITDPKTFTRMRRFAMGDGGNYLL